jgi:hypothetical protein
MGDQGSVTHLYTVRMRHDSGTVTLETAATSARSAVALVIGAERAPLSAVEWVRVRPVCDFCAVPATRYRRDNGASESGMPLCAVHARKVYGSSGVVGRLGVARLDVVPLVEWAERVDLMRQYADAHAWVVTHEMYAEQDAHTVTWFTVDGCVWLALKRSPRGLWGVETSDYVRLAVSDYDRRFPNPDAALEWASAKARVSINEVTEW